MSNLIRWQSLSEMVTLRDAMDQLFDDAFTRLLKLADGGRYRMAPSVDMFETENEVVIKVALPGTKAEEVDINVTGEMLRLKGQVKEQSETQDKAYHIHKQREGGFERSIPLPSHFRGQGQGRVREWYSHRDAPPSRRGQTQVHHGQGQVIPAAERRRPCGRLRFSYALSLARAMPIGYTLCG
jgi:HSP20 family protein